MRKSLIIALFAAAAITGHAADIDSLAAAIASANPAVRARQAELRSASLAASADAMLPGPEIEGEHLWGPSGDNRWGVGISQSFDWPGVYAAKRGARRAADNAFVQLAHAEVAEQRLAAKLALIDLVAARREAATVRDIYNNVQETRFRFILRCPKISAGYLGRNASQPCGSGPAPHTFLHSNPHIKKNTHMGD